MNIPIFYFKLSLFYNKKIDFFSNDKRRSILFQISKSVC